MKFTDWISKAKSDLGSSKVLLKEKFFDTAIYHTQQSSEKALKAFLFFDKNYVDKTHDLTFLVEECKKIETSFDFIIKEAAFLNPYSTSFRYPDKLLGDPREQEVIDAILAAEKILKFVQEKIKEKETGQKNLFNLNKKIRE